MTIPSLLPPKMRTKKQNCYFHLEGVINVLIIKILLDFVVDTASNRIRIKSHGTISTGNGRGRYYQRCQYLHLGDCQLENTSNSKNNNSTDDDEIEQGIIFMSNLTASTLHIAALTSVGILGLIFLHCFPGGAKFTWE